MLAWLIMNISDASLTACKAQMLLLTSGHIFERSHTSGVSFGEFGCFPLESSADDSP